MLPTCMTKNRGRGLLGGSMYTMRSPFRQFVKRPPTRSCWRVISPRTVHFIRSIGLTLWAHPRPKVVGLWLTPVSCVHLWLSCMDSDHVRPHSHHVYTTHLQWVSLDLLVQLDIIGATVHRFAECQQCVQYLQFSWEKCTHAHLSMVCLKAVCLSPRRRRALGCYVRVLRWARPFLHTYTPCKGPNRNPKISQKWNCSKPILLNTCCYYIATIKSLPKISKFWSSFTQKIAENLTVDIEDKQYNII